MDPGVGPGPQIPSFMRDIPDPEKPIGNPASIKTPLGAVLGAFLLERCRSQGRRSEGAISGKFEW